MGNCGSLAKLQKGGTEIGSQSLGLPTDAEWVPWAEATLTPPHHGF